MEAENSQSECSMEELGKGGGRKNGIGGKNIQSAKNWKRKVLDNGRTANKLGEQPQLKVVFNTYFNYSVLFFSKVNRARFAASEVNILNFQNKIY